MVGQTRHYNIVTHNYIHSLVAYTLLPQRSILVLVKRTIVVYINAMLSDVS